ILTDYTHHQSMSFWTGRMSGSVNSQINYVAQGLNVVEHFLRIIFAIVVMAVNVGLILQVNTWVALIFACVFVFRLVYGLYMMKPMKAASKAASASSSALSGKIVDSISNFSVVKLFAGANKERKHLEQPRQENIKNRKRSFLLNRMFSTVPNMVWDVAFGFTLYLCIVLYMRGEIAVSEIVFSTSVFFNVMGMIAQIINSIPPIVETLGSASKAYTELVVPVSITDAPNAPDLQVTCGTIEFRNVSFKYKRKWVLKDLNLKIKCGERVGIVGPSGAGKTTLVHLLMRFWDPTHGQILIDGQDIKEYTQDSLRENIAFIPQDPTMFNRTLRENIGYGKVNATDAEIRRAAKRAAAHDFIMETDKKYDSLVGDRGIKLSGGQRQRIAIARAFLKDAPILVLDEATSALDSETEVAIQESFDELATGRTTVAIAHRLSTLRNMDRIIVIKDCHIIEQGSHQSLLRKRGEYARLWKMQSGGFLQE
ncbi:MAG: ABC transporter ATP-binding protein, partial [Alphaproteobacteria bacterium]|nr:ABC transporter ATP-binding protein [Alphaproteobacteria bacterium]